MRAAGSFFVDFAFAEGAKAGGLFGRFSFFFLIFEIVEFIDHLDDEEQADRDANKIDDRLKEQTVGNLGRADHPLHLFIVVLLGDQRKQRHNNAVYKRIYNCGERRTDNHTNGKINYISLKRESFELIPDFLHVYSSLPLN